MEYDQETILALIREERDRLERSLDFHVAVWSDPRHHKLPSFDYEGVVQKQRLQLAHLNKLMLRYL